MKMEGLGGGEVSLQQPLSGGVDEPWVGRSGHLNELRVGQEIDQQLLVAFMGSGLGHPRSSFWVGGQPVEGVTTRPTTLRPIAGDHSCSP
jgi:hypothetical protein